MTALRTLLSTSELYKEAHISIDEDWIYDNTGNTHVFIQVIHRKSDDESDTFSEVGDEDNARLMTLLDNQTKFCLLHREKDNDH